VAATEEADEEPTDEVLLADDNLALLYKERIEELFVLSEPVGRQVEFRGRLHSG
jgi:hypothetical protein